MQQSKVIQLMRCFSNVQLKHIGFLLVSPYFNKREALVPFYEFLLRYKPDFNHVDLTKASILEKFMPLKSFTEKDLSYCMSDLVKVMEDYIVLEKLNDKKIQRNNMLLEFYHDNSLNRSFQATLKKSQKHQGINHFRNAWFYYDQYWVHSQENQFFDRQKKHVFNQSLQNSIDNLDVFYLSLKLKYSCEIINRQQIVAPDYHLRLLNEIMLYLEQHPHEEQPAISIYATILRCLTEFEKESHFEELKSLLAQKSGQFPVTEARDMYMYAINYCVRKINSGNSHYFKELFEIYQSVLNKSLIFDGGFLSPWTYKNIVEVGLRNEAFDWLEDFIAIYKNKLHPKFRENAYTYSLATLYFHQGKFKDALGALYQVSFDDVFYSTESKMLLIRIYYELDETEPLLSLTDSFTVYLRRNKLLSENHRTVYLNFVKFAARLGKIPKGNTKRLLRLEEKIKLTKNTANRTWLLQKLTLKK